MMLAWRLYYADGGTFSAADGAWEDAPGRGVVGLVTPSDLAGTQIHTDDFYIWAPGADQPWSCDSWGLLDLLLELGLIKPEDPLTLVSLATLEKARVKLGRSVPAADWRVMREQMAADPDFPRKSAYHRSERR